MFRTLLFVASTVLSGCGQTGPLYPQPEPEPEALTDSSPTAGAQRQP